MPRQKIKKPAKVKTSAPAAADPLAELKKSPVGRAYLKKAEAAFNAQAKSADVVLPGPLATAFGADGSLTLGNFTLLPVSLYTPVILAQIKSPLLDVIRIMREEMVAPVAVDEATAEGQAEAHALRLKNAHARMVEEIASDGVANLETIFCFLTPSEELEKLISIGREQLRAAARAKLRHVPLLILNQLQQACAAQYGRSYATVIQYGGAPKEGEVFTPPPAGPKTA